MNESGGANTQAGIFYQNSVAALALADLLELAPQPPRDRVIQVRVEAPENVDDVVVHYADGHRQFQNIKTSVSPGSAPWVRLWQNLRAQASQSDFQAEDELAIIFEEANPVARGLRDMCDRASSSVDDAEWCNRLTQGLERLLRSIEAVLGSTSDVLELLRRTTIKIVPLDQIEDEFARRRLGGGFALPATLLSVLRDIASGGARKRALFLAAPLRRRLIAEHNVEIVFPSEWGLAAYRSTIARLARIEIPGTGVSGSADELFVWPRTRIYERTRRADFEDENPFYRLTLAEEIIDITSFPSEPLRHLVIIAGPGYGKSALLTAISGRLAQSPYVPVVVPLASLASSAVGIVEFLTVQVNGAFDIKADWLRLAEQGLLVLLFDGLDEIPSGSRPTLLRSISTFSARFPLSPWMLTVRDAAVLTGTSDAQLVEILPLEDSDIQRFVETMKTRLTSLDVRNFVDQLTKYPDLNRLARIPLFLSMLLVTVDGTDELPTTRSDLIEAYLKTIFAPHEHKEVSGSHDKTTQLRSIAETLAFERLERQEVGASEREVREIVTRTADNSGDAESLFQRLRANGILRQQSAIRLQFPYPIVQEYLAACHLVRHFPDSLVNRFDDAVQRPWAQVIQFALELHPKPLPILRAMLDRSDDAFSTGLRLVGRCIANGTKVDEAIRNEVSDRLVAFWIGAPTFARGLTGKLLEDGFCKTIRPSLKKALHHPWLLSSGGGEILEKINDQDLTMSVLVGLMDREPQRFFMHHNLKPAISAAGDVAFNAILARMSKNDCAKEHVEMLGNLLEHFNSGSVTRELALAAALDERYPREVRLQAFVIVGAPLDERSLPIIDGWLASDDQSGHWIALRLFALHPDGRNLLLRALGDARLSYMRRRNLVGGISQVIPVEAERIDFIRYCLTAPTIDPELGTVLRLFAARYGDKTEFETLVAQISHNPIEIVGQTVSLFGHYGDRELAERAADILRQRVENGKDAALLSHSATCGMLYIYDMDLVFGGVLNNTHPHAAIEYWMQLVEDWTERTDLTELERLKLLTAASQLGSEKAGRHLNSSVLKITEPGDSKYDEDDYGHIISSAIGETRRRNPLLPLEFGALCVRTDRPNVPNAGIGTIVAHANLEALELMVQLHREISEWHVKDMLANTIESLAAKLGLLVRLDDTGFVIGS